MHDLSGTWASILLAVCIVSKGVITYALGHTDVNTWGTRTHISPQPEIGGIPQTTAL